MYNPKRGHLSYSSLWEKSRIRRRRRCTRRAVRRMVWAKSKLVQEASMRGVAVYLRGVTLFVAGIVVGTFLMQSGAAQAKRTGLRLNHVGIAVTDYDKAMDFYTKVMG